MPQTSHSCQSQMLSQPYIFLRGREVKITELTWVTFHQSEHNRGQSNQKSSSTSVNPSNAAPSIAALVFRLLLMS